MTEDQDVKDSQSDSGSKTFVSKNKDKKAKPHRPLTKIILRRLPPTMTEEAFLEQVSPIPEHDHFYFAKPDPSLGNNVYSRAYINFVNIDDIYLFRDKFDGYVFLDERGVEYVGIVEYAPFQRIPKKKKKKDPKCGTIESDPIYQEFLENLDKDQETENQPKLEYSYPVNDNTDKKVQSTPLLEYLAARKLDKRGRDERRRRENDKRKMRIERKTKDLPIKEEDGTENDVKKIKSREGDNDLRDDETKVNDKDGTVFESKSYKDQRKIGISLIEKKKKVDGEKKDSLIKEDDQLEEADKLLKKDRRDKFKESPREQKSKKYSDTRKERLKQAEQGKSDKQSVISKIMSAEGKSKSLNHDDIKPFTQLPQVKTEDLTKLIEDMDRKVKMDEDAKIKDSFQNKFKSNAKHDSIEFTKMRRNSMDSGDITFKEETTLKRQKSLDDRSKSSDREGSEEKDKNESSERRSERRIRNKDRPSLVIYQPGMGKFSKQRLAKEKDTQPPIGKSVNDSEKKDT
ncbi:regulator of nonsense transcripts 3B [Vanessa atalanta]|uniref:regulator of nonsense transcripts 3B n=1 Tax=Vanessa atalanta TaxID=42275 RepID=UPI001FCD9D7F|nr:regulator of nonsense transcripts 3B [Vanessa atalanta]